MMDGTWLELNGGRLGSSATKPDQSLPVCSLLALVQAYFKIPRFIFSYCAAPVQESAASESL